MDHKPLLDIDGKKFLRDAIDAFFLQARSIFSGQGVTRQGLILLGEELGRLGKTVYGADQTDPAGRGWSGVSRVLRTDPDGLTLLQVHFTAPREASAVHEHRSWWVLRVVNGEEYYTEYERLDDGIREGYAELRAGQERLLHPGDVLTALEPVIHLHRDYQGQTVDELMLLGDNPGQTPIRRFDPEAKTTFVSPPRKYGSR